MGLTGARINGTDALALGVADFGMASDDFDVLIQALTTADWSDDATKKSSDAQCTAWSVAS